MVGLDLDWVILLGTRHCCGALINTNKNKTER